MSNVEDGAGWESPDTGYENLCVSTQTWRREMCPVAETAAKPSRQQANDFPAVVIRRGVAMSEEALEIP